VQHDEQNKDTLINISAARVVINFFSVIEYQIVASVIVGCCVNMPLLFMILVTCYNIIQ
jgi:hypothetical protein